MNKIGRYVSIISVLAIAGILIFLLLIKITPTPPVSQIDKALTEIARAGRNEADIYSKRQYKEALTYYDSALVNWTRENNKLIFFRDYSKVEMFAGLSAKKANEAAINSENSSSNLRMKLKQKIESLNNLMYEINNRFNTYPLPAEVRERISKGKLILKEAEIEYQRGQYLIANRKLTDSEYLLMASYENASENLKNYFKSFPEWKSWVDKTIRESRKKRTYAIIIDKFSRRCIIYQSGTKKYEFEAELGRNWVGNKRMTGDKTTPEGMYKIVKKFEGSKTRYYKALLLDYPNNDDKKRFNDEIERGTLPESAKIGGLIEIHGNGGKGIDWTEGCIALADNEMDVVFRIVKAGTPVTIVGSLVDLQNIKKK